MRFRFCGDSDCPDWVLLEVTTLSKLSSVRMKVLVLQILSYCIQGTYNNEKLLKLAADNAEGLSDIKGAVAAVHFMIVNAAKYDVDEESLSTEVQQLGLPKENADIIARQFREHKEALRARFGEESYRTSRLLSADWRLDQVIASSQQGSLKGPLLHLKLQIDTKPQSGAVDGVAASDADGSGSARIQNDAFELSVEKLDVLVHELTAARNAFRELES